MTFDMLKGHESGSHRQHRQLLDARQPLKAQKWVGTCQSSHSVEHSEEVLL